MLWDIRGNYYKIGKGTISRGTAVYAGTAWYGRYLPVPAGTAWYGHGTTVYPDRAAVSTCTVIEAVLSCCMNELLQVNLYIDNATRIMQQEYRAGSKLYYVN
eukprot:SAG31_NODE_1298_length_8922_cov_18.816956_1_plen_102_part_00